MLKSEILAVTAYYDVIMQFSIINYIRKDRSPMAKITVNETYCKGCELCVEACPRHIIALDAERINAKGYHPAAQIEGSECVGCCCCALMCPDMAITVEK